MRSGALVFTLPALLARMLRRLDRTVAGAAR